MAKLPKHYIQKGQEIEDFYAQNIFFGFIISIGIIALLFAGVKKIEFGTYKPAQLPKPVTIEFMPVIQRIEEPPPPVKPRINVRIVEVKKEKSDKVKKERSLISQTESKEEIIQEQAPINPIENVPLPTATSEEVYEFFKVEIKPQVIKSVPPEYPEYAKKAGIEGRVVISAVVDEEGNVVDAQIVSSTNSIFNEPALKAAYQYKFSPAMMKDKKVKVRVLIPFNFVIKK
ncbi:MAG: TonB family protein [candidate division WOR-3 bacterium]